MKKLSVVIPVYACAPCLRELATKLTSVLKNIPMEYEIVMVDDRSPDEAWKEISKLNAENNNVRGIRLSRNFGQHLAITAGIEAAKGDVLVVMDCDLQDPPEVIPELLKKYSEGFDIVLVRRIRAANFFRAQLSRVYFYLLKVLTGAVYDSSYGTLSLIDRKVAEAFLKIKDAERHYLFVLHWLGFKKGEITFRHDQRYAGRSSYSLKSLLKHALSGLLFQSPTFLVWVVITGFCIAGIGFLSATFLFVRYFLYQSLPGWTSIAVLIFTFGGLNLMIIGAMGLYIGKVFAQVKNRPLYVVDQSTN